VAPRLSAGTEPYPGYRLVQFLGRGGWGEVWLAEAPRGTHVALKFLPCDTQLAAVHEIRALQSIRQLRHPYLIRIDRIWADAGHVVIAMELAEGSLVDLLDVYQADYRTAVHPDHLCYYLAQAADALDFLNARQHLIDGRRVAVRHCDVKPSNLLVLDGQVKVADFSLAAQTTSPMGAHRRVGTLNYIAPELFQGYLSDRSDQFSLAVTYCELRLGRLPFPDVPPRAGKDFLRPPPDLGALSPGEAQVLARALSPVPHDRWPTCTELMDRLAWAVKRHAPPAQPLEGPLSGRRPTSSRFPRGTYNRGPVPQT
jgi:serine/threonine protein kinase